MVKQKRPKLSWLFIIILITFFRRTYSTQIVFQKEYDLNEFYAGLEGKIQPQQFIRFDFEGQGAFKRAGNGIYKLIPYYQKVFPQDREKSRFIIEKHAFAGEW